MREMIEAGGVTPLVPYPGAGTAWKSRCNGCGKVVRPRLASIRSGHSGCSSCANVGKGMVDAEHARRVMIERGNVSPLEPYPGNAKRWRCVCNTCGAEVTPTYVTVASSGLLGCRYCGIRAGAATRTTPGDEATAEMISAGAIPIEPFQGVKRPWRCRCANPDCGRTITPTLGNVKSGASPCKYCAKHGFAYADPAIVYILINDAEGAYKVGVAGTGTTRLDMLTRLGWEVIATYPTPTGAEAVDVEQRVFARLRERGVDRGYVARDRMPRGGHTETFAASAITRSALIRLVRRQVRVGKND